MYFVKDCTTNEVNKNKEQMKSSVTIKLELCAFDLDLLKDAINFLKVDRDEMNDTLRSVRLRGILNQLEGQENKY